MMINFDYTAMVEQARAKGDTSVKFDNRVTPIAPITAKQDTVTLSKQAQALLNGNNIDNKEVAPTYIKPQTARSLLAESEATSASSSDKAEATKKSAKNARFNEIMQSILDQRLGIDREKLNEINAMIEDIAKNEKMSDEEKEQAIKMLEEVREKIIEESLEVQKVAKQTDKVKDAS